MIRTIIVQIIIDENNNTYEIGNRVRVKMKPSNIDRPELASEHIGYIDDIKEGIIDVATAVGIRCLYVEHIDRIRLAAADENFDNQWDF
jgi:hypothetical protein